MLAPTLLRRTTPVPAATIAAAQLPTSQQGNPRVSPRFPPGFPSPRFLRSDLLAALFPQLQIGSPDLRIQDGAPLPVCCAAVSGATRRPRKVRFAAQAALLDPTPNLPVHGALRPCLKVTPTASVSAGRRTARDASTSPASPVAGPRRSSPSSHAPSCADSRRSSSSSPDADIGRSEDWHLVRPAYWWRQRRPDLQRPSRRVASSSGWSSRKELHQSSDDVTTASSADSVACDHRATAA
ncbi:uncharacterized protein LOC119337823 [Triticum dicoccoides]|uniref:uncharacterized protein LOC119337823 n=1 Tax=Triticum dicoccoides TaxID=85692 RepID=UPI0018911CA6|nr:uncharacterized protein LOC119337823 [Triticum dicoccoides]